MKCAFIYQYILIKCSNGNTFAVCQMLNMRYGNVEHAKFDDCRMRLLYAARLYAVET